MSPEPQSPYQYVFVRIRCPKCGSSKLKILRSEYIEEDDTSIQRRVCRECEFRFWMALE